MITKWVTVVSWKKGVAVLRSYSKISCINCNACSTCNLSTLNELTPNTGHTLQIHIAQQLYPGQSIQIGITEVSLLHSVIIVYFIPLLGIILGSSLLQYLLDTELFTALGALLGGGISFIIVRILEYYFSKKDHYQPIILRIGEIPVLGAQQD
ncbi:RseC protein involved in reduction of the SoxR iron-sulfur cluster [Serratia symbiotica str. 'Cinara cedri']|nr:RseC protein involved in reduction of the SoxR iron-sulfur cluster [Serratia symbiotica str. 'Cinara cedri']